MTEVNGASLQAGAVAMREPPAPIVGTRRCRITRPLSAPPAHAGRFGRGWLVDLPAARSKLPYGTPPDAMVVHWVVEAPWSSEVVHSYSLICVHLRFSFNLRPVVRHIEGATHEVALWVLHPEVDRGAMLAAPVNPDCWLQPVVFASQIVVPDDAAAVARMGHVVELICSGRLSPHPTHVRAWAGLLGDNMLRAALRTP